MIDINWRPTPRELRTFGLAFLVASAVVGGLLAWQFGLGWVSWALWAAGPVVAVVALAVPRWLRPLYLALTLLAFPIGLVVGTVLLGLTYYVVVTGIGLAFRLFGKDPMHRRFDPEASSYWVRRRPPADVGRYFRQF